MKTRVFAILTVIFVIGSAITALADGKPQLAGGVLADTKTPSETTETPAEATGVLAEVIGMLTGTEETPTEISVETEGIPYLEYYADLRGIDPADIDLTRAVSLSYSIQECEFGYPVQTIRDEESILAAAEFFRNVYVTGEPDGVFSTEGGEGLSLQDEDGNTIISIFIQAGMIDTSDGRRPANGLGGIDDIPGLMSGADWEDYYAQQEEEEEIYRKTHEINYPCSMFEMEGKAAFDFFLNCTADDIDSIYFFHNGKNKTVTDRDAIQIIYDSLCQVQVTGSGQATRWDEQWSITLFYTPKNSTFSSDIRFGFRAGDLYDDEAYSLDGLDGILDSYDWDEFAVIKEAIES